MEENICCCGCNNFCRKNRESGFWDSWNNLNVVGEYALGRSVFSQNSGFMSLAREFVIGRRNVFFCLNLDANECGRTSC